MTSRINRATERLLDSMPQGTEIMMREGAQTIAVGAMEFATRWRKTDEHMDFQQQLIVPFIERSIEAGVREALAHNGFPERVGSSASRSTAEILELNDIAKPTYQYLSRPLTAEDLGRANGQYAFDPQEKEGLEEVSFGITLIGSASLAYEVTGPLTTRLAADFKSSVLAPYATQVKYVHLSR